MDTKSLAVDWSVALPVVVATVAPTVIGFLQQFSKKWIEGAPWYAKGILTSGMAALLGIITSYAAQGDALLGAAGGALVGAIGAMNIAFRKGTRGNLEVIINKEVESKVALRLEAMGKKADV